MERKIIQIQPTGDDQVMALCNDGTLWVSEGLEWRKCPDIPQGDKDEH